MKAQILKAQYVFSSSSQFFHKKSKIHFLGFLNEMISFWTSVYPLKLQYKEVLIQLYNTVFERCVLYQRAFCMSYQVSEPASSIRIGSCIRAFTVCRFNAADLFNEIVIRMKYIFISKLCSYGCHCVQRASTRYLGVVQTIQECTDEFR